LTCFGEHGDPAVPVPVPALTAVATPPPSSRMREIFFGTLGGRRK